MDGANLSLFWVFAVSAALIFITGFYSILAGHNLLRTLIGVELLIKAVTLLLVVCGYISGHIALAQSLVITLIVVEVVFITIAVGVVLGIHRHYGSLDARNIRKLQR